jgi:hypothetical protein
MYAFVYVVATCVLAGSGELFLWGTGHKQSFVPSLVEGIDPSVRISQVRCLWCMAVARRSLCEQLWLID